MIDFIFKKLDEVDSTNDYAERLLDDKSIDRDAIIISKSQTNGHGTNNRKFISNKNVGIYFTFLHFYKDISELNFITQKVAVAIYNVFYNIFNIELQIKWINDLYYKNKKVVGILCRNLIKYKAVIIGVGIDLFYDEFIKNYDIDDANYIIGYIFENKKDLIDKLNNNTKLSHDSCIYNNIYNDFKYLEFDDIIINDNELWEPDSLVVQIVLSILDLIKVVGLPSLYIEKNIIKDKKIYEDINLQC